MKVTGRRIPSHRLSGFVTGGRQSGHQFLVVPGLHDEVERPFLHSLHRQLDIGISGKQNHFHLRHYLLDFSGPEQAFVAGVDACVEVHVQKHHIRTEAFQGINQRDWRGQRLNLREMHRQQDFQRLADPGVVIHNEYLSFFRSHIPSPKLQFISRTNKSADFGRSGNISIFR